MQAFRFLGGVGLNTAPSPLLHTHTHTRRDRVSPLRSPRGHREAQQPKKPQSRNRPTVNHQRGSPLKHARVSSAKRQGRRHETGCANAARPYTRSLTGLTFDQWRASLA